MSEELSCEGGDARVPVAHSPFRSLVRLLVSLCRCLCRCFCVPSYYNAQAQNLKPHSQGAGSVTAIATSCRHQGNPRKGKQEC